MSSLICWNQPNHSSPHLRIMQGVFSSSLKGYANTVGFVPFTSILIRVSILDFLMLASELVLSKASQETNGMVVKKQGKKSHAVMPCTAHAFVGRSYLLYPQWYSTHCVHVASSIFTEISIFVWCQDKRPESWGTVAFPFPWGKVDLIAESVGRVQVCGACTAFILLLEETSSSGSHWHMSPCGMLDEGDCSKFL